METIVKNIICIFTIKDGKVYVITDDDKIPCITCNNEIDIVNKKYTNKLNIPDLSLKQTYTFSEKNGNILTFYILFNDIVNYDIVKDYDMILFEDIKDHKFISKSINYLKENIVMTNNLNKIFTNEFALPELQKLLENILNIKYDRRNFRKKLLSKNVIEQIDKTNNSEFGRPAKLYRFTNNEDRKVV